MKKLACLVLTCSMALSLTLPAQAANMDQIFPVVNFNPEFTDVLERDWFYTAVDVCAKVGLMTGTSSTNIGDTFSPNKVLTVGEVAAIAARMNEAVTGKAIPTTGGSPWYQPYVSYLNAQGISVPDGAKTATRQDFADLLTAVVPADLLQPINKVDTLPDTSDPDVLLLYNAGILTGTDDWGTFAGSKSLTRAETAAMVARVARDDLRQSFTPADYRLLTAAGLNQDDVLFQSDKVTVTAGQFLPALAKRLGFLEGQYGGFSWNNMYGDQTYYDYVLEGAFDELGVSEAIGTALYQQFDLKDWYTQIKQLGANY